MSFSPTYWSKQIRNRELNGYPSNTHFFTFSYYNGEEDDEDEGEIELGSEEEEYEEGKTKSAIIG